MRRLTFDWCGEKTGENILGGVGGLIRHGSGSHNSEVSGSSSDVVLSQRREYYQMEVRGKNLKDELSHISGDWCGITPVVLSASMGEYIGRVTVLRGWDDQDESHK